MATKTTVKQMILEHLKSGKSITPLEALTEYNCLSLAQRVYDLSREGYSINREMVQDKRTGKVYARYSMGDEK